MTTKKKNPHIGSSLDSFLKEDGLYDEVAALVIKEKIAFQLKRRMEAKKISVNGMAKAMKTSRTQINRLLDPTNGNVTLASLQKAAAVVGRSVRLELV
ncbi:MAG: XRE family transcriptional regulator [Alphaproteobacteria bacterium]|nr:XRE family transcriptional regulator [Alphaproteobacteria bacterium]